MEVNRDVTESISKETEGIKNELTFFTVNMLNLYSQNERSGNPNEDITMHKIKTQHLIIYYLYRVFCKYRDNIMNVIPIEDINKMYALLNIPENSRGCMPMAGRLSNKKKQLDLALFTLIKVLNDFNMKQKGKLSPDKFNDMLAFFRSKQNIKKILEDFKVLNILIPNLSNTNVEYNIFDKNRKKETLLELGIEPYNNDVTLSKSNTSFDNVADEEKVDNLTDTARDDENNALQKELENAEKAEFNASEVVVQNSPDIQQEDLPEVASLENNNQNTPTESTTEAPTESTEVPTESTEAPTESTEVPTESTTEAPIESIETPTESTETPTPPPKNNSILNESVSENNASNELNKL